MEIMQEHVENLRLLLDGVPEKYVAKTLEGHAMTWSKWRMGDADESAYPALQTSNGRKGYVDVKKEMWNAIQTGDYIEIDNSKTDALCNVCGNLKDGVCRLSGRPIRRNR